MGSHTFEVTDSSFQADVLSSETPVLVDFWADWCQPCKMIAPIVDEVATRYEGRLRVAKLDIDSNPTITESYNIQGIPTLVLFKGGEAVHYIVGYRTRDKLEAELNKHLMPEQA